MPRGIPPDVVIAGSGTDPTVLERAGVREADLGTIEPGKIADFTGFSGDLMVIPEPEILKVQPAITVIADSAGVSMSVSMSGTSKASSQADTLGLISTPPSRKPRMIETTVSPSIQPLATTKIGRAHV